MFVHAQDYYLVLIYFSYIIYVSNGGWRASNMAAMQISQVVTISPYADLATDSETSLFDTVTGNW